ncbi:MAG: FimV/HubP family polar landmark protein [Succinivibrio sp.]
MHTYKKFILQASLALLLPFSAGAVDDDGTFTITIQGPEVEDLVTVPRAQPARRPARVQTPQTAVQRALTPATPAGNAQTLPQTRTTPQANTQAAAQAAAQGTVTAPARTYNVAPGDTIWSVAHRYLPQDRSFNEFQIVASIYRNNPNAFLNRNVNQLTRTTITIPDDAEIAKESMQVGSQLLSRGSMVLPPLEQSAPAAVTASPSENSAPQVATTEPAASQTAAAPVAQTEKTASESKDSDIPQYTATETKIKQMQEEMKNKELGVLIPTNTNGADNDKSDVNANNDSKKPAANVTAQNNAEVAVDTQAIRIMLEENKRSIDQKTKVLEQQLAEAMERMKKSSAATAKTAADSVATLSSQYDNIISGLQQDIIEIKGALSKLSQDNDRMREMLLANDEKIEDMQLQLSQFSITSPTSQLDLNRPVMMILFGAGLLSLVMLIVFLIFKAKARANARVFSDDFDVDDDYSSEDTLLSDENGSITLEDNIDDSEAEEVKAAPVPSEEEKKEAPKPEKKAEPQEEKSDVEKILEDSETEGEVYDESQDAAQAEWDNAAATENKEAKDDKKNGDENVLSEWSKALEEQNEDDRSVEVSKTDENSVADDLKAQSESSAEDKMADAWAQALDEQEKGESSDKAPSSEQEAMASAWAQALDEQEKGESSDKAPSSEQEAMASAWSQALDEQEKSESAQESVPSEQEAMASAWSRALNESEIAKDADNESPLEQEADQSLNPESATDQDDVISKDVIDESLQTDKVEQLSESDEIIQDVSSDDKSNPDEQSQVVVEDVSEDELLAEFANNAQSMTEQQETADTDNEVSQITDETDAVVVADNADGDADVKTADDMTQENVIDEPKIEDELSGEEKAFIKAVSENQSVDELETENSESIQNDNDVLVQSEPDSLESSSDKSNESLGTKVDEVLNDDLDLEELLTGGTEQTEDSEQAGADENQSADESLITDNTVSDTVQSEDSTVNEQPQDASDEAESGQDILSNEDPTVESENENTEAETKVADAESEHADAELENESESQVVSWAVPEDEYDIVGAKEGEEAPDNEKGLLDNSDPEYETDEAPVESESQEALHDETSEESDIVGNIQAEQSDEDPDMNEPVSEDSAEQTQDDLLELETRLSASASQIDPDADMDIMNMLSSPLEESKDTPIAQDKAFSADDIVSMMSSATHIEQDTDFGDLQLEDNVNEPESAQADSIDNSLESVSDVIGPIGSDELNDAELDNEHSSAAYEGLSAKEHQYYVDELNLARLYFETGDTEEALKIIDDVKEHGSDDLKDEASKIIETYTN